MGSGTSTHETTSAELLHPIDGTDIEEAPIEEVKRLRKIIQTYHRDITKVEKKEKDMKLKIDKEKKQKLRNGRCIVMFERYKNMFQLADGSLDFKTVSNFYFFNESNL